MVTAMRTRSRGFTLTEVMIVVTIGAVLAAVGLPNFNSFVAKMRLKTAVTDLHSTLILARSEALKRNAVVSVVPTNTADWSQGWSVKFGTAVLSKQDPYSAVTFTPASASFGTKTVTSISFQGTGREGSSDGIGFILTATNYPSIDARCVILDPSGRPTVRVDKDHNSSNGC